MRRKFYSRINRGRPNTQSTASSDGNGVGKLILESLFATLSASANSRPEWFGVVFEGFGGAIFSLLQIPKVNKALKINIKT